jgi:hypothetical protein
MIIIGGCCASRRRSDVFLVSQAFDRVGSVQTIAIASTNTCISTFHTLDAPCQEASKRPMLPR